MNRAEVLQEEKGKITMVDERYYNPGILNNILSPLVSSGIDHIYLVYT